MATSAGKAPPERHETVRRALRRALEDGPWTARQLSVSLRVSEKEVVEHLDALRRARSIRLVIRPAACEACGFEFEDRRRAGRPSRCPKCKSERIEAPAFTARARGQS